MKGWRAITLGLIAAAPLASASPAAAGTEWTVTGSPNTTTQIFNSLRGVTCVSSTECWAVGNGSDFAHTHYTSLIELFDGSSWRRVKSADVGTATDVLVGVTCTSTTNCWAVGDTNSDTLIEHFDGSSWSVVPSPNLSTRPGNILSGVNCASATECWAVGSAFTDNSDSLALIEHFDGASWTLASLAPGTPSNSSLAGVACSAGNDCWAGGHDSQGALIEHYDGVVWSAVKAGASSHHPRSDSLSAISCGSSIDCWAVGSRYSDQYGGLIEHYDGMVWKTIQAPTAPHSQLSSIACLSSSNCWASGSGYSGKGNVGLTSLIEHYDGSAWVVVPSPRSTTGYVNDDLMGIACASASECWADGTSNDGTLIQGYDGVSWAAVTSPNTQAIQDNALRAVACASASECWAVGNDGFGDVLIEGFDGRSWRIASASPNSLGNYMTGVACASTSECWAVGTSNSDRPLIERFNGSTWSSVSEPRVSPDPYRTVELTAVACAAVDACWAVGCSSFCINTLIEHYDGTSWRAMKSPAIANVGGQLGGVGCAAVSECWAVGAEVKGGYGQTLIERWDGTAWTIVHSPDTSTTEDNGLGSVSCVSRTDCWAIGSHGASQALIEHWNGTSWTIIGAPSSGPSDYDLLRSVACASATQCWAAGEAFGQSTAERTLVFGYDGTAWTVAGSQNTTDPLNRLFGVACAPGSTCWAVGDRIAADNTAQTLVERSP